MIEPLEHALRREGRQVLATLIRLTGDIDRAEDALHDALVVAAQRWPLEGAPAKPGAWLTTVARNKALDRIRREARRGPVEAEAVRLLADYATELDDSTRRVDQLRLLFTCCHPALNADAQVALALRVLCGLSTTDIARLFLVPEATIGQRISRAKAKIVKAHIAYRVPPDHELPDRLRPVLATVYSVFTAGHHAPTGDTTSRIELADEAIHLGRNLVELMPDEEECAGLLALMLATNARRAARIDSAGETILLADQERSLWDHAAIAEAETILNSALRRGRPGAYQIQAAVACLHGLAPTFADTDWPQIAELYTLLEQRWPTLAVRVNRAVAVAECDGPRAGLALLSHLNGSGHQQWHLYWATLADFHRRLGQADEARRAYSMALQCQCNDTDRRFLERRVADLDPLADAAD